MGKWICLNCKMYLFIWGPIYGAVHSSIYPMLHIAHCSCSYLVCLWLTGLLARGGQNARGQAGQAQLPPYGELTLGQLFFSFSTTNSYWLCLPSSISASCIVDQMAIFKREDIANFVIIS